MYKYFYNLKAPGSHHLNILYWVYSMIMINTEAKVNCCTVISHASLYCSLVNSNQEPSVMKVYNMVKISIFLADSNQFPSDWMSMMLPLSYQTVYKLNNTTVVIKTFVTVILAFINSYAAQSQWAAIFLQKATTTVSLGFCLHPYSLLLPL